MCLNFISIDYWFKAPGDEREGERANHASRDPCGFPPAGERRKIGSALFMSMLPIDQT
jgi:hypothetical protein